MVTGRGKHLNRTRRIRYITIMASYATAFLIGKLTRDPELRTAPQGKAICSFSVAVNRKSRAEDEVSFFDIEAWEKTAELCQKFLAKGRSVMVAGRLKQDTWTDKTSGQKRSKIKVIANDVQFLDPKPAEAAPGDGGETPAAGVSHSVGQSRNDDDSSIPF